MRTNTEKYEASHGKKPRGAGHWAFELTGTDGRGAYLTETVFSSGKLTDARNQAVRNFKASYGRVKEVVEVVVLP